MMSRQFILVLFFHFTVGSLSEAQDISQSFIRWYKPKIESSKKPHRFRAVLSGKASPGTQIEIASDEISILTDAENIEVVGANEIMSGKSVNADKNGNFFLNLEMPRGIVQLPIEVKFSVAESKLYQINIAPPPNGAGSDFSNPGSLATHQDLPHFLSKKEVWGGIGMNFLRYNQESEDIPSNLTLESIDGPTIYAKFVRSLNSEWAFKQLSTDGQEKPFLQQPSKYLRGPTPGLAYPEILPTLILSGAGHIRNLLLNWACKWVFNTTRLHFCLVPVRPNQILLPSNQMPFLWVSSAEYGGFISIGNGWLKPFFDISILFPFAMNSRCDLILLSTVLLASSIIGWKTGGSESSGTVNIKSMILRDSLTGISKLPGAVAPLLMVLNPFYSRT
ncbi:MAG: hypothetical protein IPK68_13805 [Bdellovibrionales bacterium]|nr:hypothetical protein [Bdellovibrionales bacterium]